MTDSETVIFYHFDDLLNSILKIFWALKCKIVNKGGKSESVLPCNCLQFFPSLCKYKIGYNG